MKTSIRRTIMSTALAAALAGVAPVALAQSTTTIEQEVVVIDRSATEAASQPAEKMAQSFAPLVGSETDSLAVVDGLRSGSEFTLVGETEDIVITPAAPMGYGNVFATLALAQESLAAIGITEPTAEELAVALQGGEIVIDGTVNEFDGVLTMRESGMGWGEIANSLGLRLGAVVSAENRSPMAQSKVAAADPQGGEASPAGSPSVGAKGGQVVGVGGSPGGGRSGNSGGNGGGNGGGGKGGGRR